MAKPDIKDVDGTLGDITSLMHNSGVSDLSWLEVDPDEYRKFEALPKQNLDSIPELTRALAWDGQDERVPQLVPMRPHTVVNTNPLEERANPNRFAGSVAHRVAHYLMAGMPDSEIAKRIPLEFSPAQIAAESAEALALIHERGLIGNVYVAASHFPRCAQEGPHREFVAKRAPRALYVIAKEQCGGCVHNQGGRCASLKKEIVPEVPYDQRTVAHYLPELANQGRVAGSVSQMVTSKDGRRELLRRAFLAAPVPFCDGGPMVARTQPKQAHIQVTEADVADFRRRQMLAASADKLPGPNALTVARRMMEGPVDPVAISASLDLEVHGLRSEHGILGSTYLDGDALGGVAETLRFIRTRGCDPDFVLLRSVSAADASSPAWTELSKSVRVVSSKPAIGRENFERACRRAAVEGRMTREMAESAVRNASEQSDWAKLTSQANLFVMQQEPRRVEVSSAYIGRVHHMGATLDERTPVREVDPEEVRRSVSHMMNLGFTGGKLVDAVLSRYTRDELQQFPELGTRLAAEDGVQGTYYVDPTAYPDYGHGCSVGSEAFRKRGAPHVLAASGCTGCRLQTHPGWCSKYAKQLIRSVPDEVRAVVAARRHLPVLSSAPVRNPVAEFELAAELTVDPAPSKPKPVEITLGGLSVID